MATSTLLLSHLRRFTRSPSHAPLLYHLLRATLPPPEPSESPYFKHSPVSSRFFHSGSVDDDSLTDSGAYSVPIPVEIVNFCDGVMGSGKESILPVQTLISVLDAYYNLCGFPWWVIIATSTLAFRLALLHVVVLQLCKLRNIAELSPKCPMFYVRFYQYSENVTGGSSSITRDIWMWMLPLFFIGYCIPQQLSLKHPAVHVKLGLPDKDAPSVLEKSEEIDSPGKHLDSPAKQRKISLKDLTHQGLVALSVKHLSKGSKERAISFLQLALDKDLDYISALIVMGQTQLQKGLLAEAIGYLERAISKLFVSDHPTEFENSDLLIVASQWAGVARIKQGQTAEGIVHLERIANLAEPEEKSSKVHSYDGLVLLSSALYNVGCKAEAVKHLRLAAAYNPEYNGLLQQCENANDDFTSDLSGSGRGD